MARTISRLTLLAAAGAVAILMADGASARQHADQTSVPGGPSAGRTALIVTGGGTGDAEMLDHTGMGGAGGPSAARSVGSLLGSGTGDAGMDHAGMGAMQGSGGDVAIGSTAGGGTGDAEVMRGPGVGPPRT